MDKIGAAVWATGRAGQVIVNAGLTRPWLEFRGGIVYNPAKEGLDLGEACGLDVRVGATVSADVDAVLARPDIDVVFYAGIGTPAEVAAACLRANRAGKDAITVAGLVHPRTILGTDAAGQEVNSGPAPTRRRPGGIRESPAIAIHPDFDLTRIRVYVDSPKVPGWNEIDAVGLLDDNGVTHWGNRRDREQHLCGCDWLGSHGVGAALLLRYSST